MFGLKSKTGFGDKKKIGLQETFTNKTNLGGESIKGPLQEED